ncbi:MAG: response regulator [Deltaproteobacteria bacterium]|nr:response regulator [Deltaproteobacteria bacterium]
MGTAFRVLVVDDSDRDTVLLLREIGRGGYDVSHARVDSEAAMAAALDRQAWDVIICDYSMPGFDTLAALALVHGRNLDVPFIVVSGTISDDAAVECMKAGAHDFMRKGNLARLRPAIQRELRDMAVRAEFKRAEEALRRESQRNTVFLRNASDGVHILDAAGNVVEVSDSFCTMLGYTRDELVGANLTLWDARWSPLELAQVVAEQLADNEPSAFETRHRRRDGSVFDVEVSGRALDLDGHRVLFNSARDITARKQADAARLELEEQLRLSQRMEAIGGLAGGVAHDFNNLLAVILSYTGFALEDVRKHNLATDDLLEVQRAANRAAGLTRQLLAFSRKQILQPVPLSVSEVAAGLENMLRRIVGEDVELVQSLAPDVGLTLADPGQIEQVIMNLVVNARDAMPNGGRLTIETANVEITAEDAARRVAVQPGAYVQVVVSDTGCGMGEETQARIFDPFFTTKEKGKGTGLGLSTVYGIVKQSGGAIWVHSELGRGSTFTVSLPRDPSATAAAPIRPSMVTARCAGTETILLVEDEEALRKVALRALATAGYKVLSAADGSEALQRSAQHAGDIHLLLTDVVMPRMSGRELAQVLLQQRPTVKVLYMSGYTDNAIVHHGVLDAGTRLLAKPFTAGELAYRVRETLDDGTANVAAVPDEGGP